MLTAIKNWLVSRETGELRSRNAGFWDASGSGNRLAGWKAQSTNWSTSLSAELLKQRARDGYRSNPYLRRAVEMISGDAIGGGIKPQFSGQYKRQAQDAWDEWSEGADFSERGDLYAFEKAAVETTLIDGEALCKLVPGPRLKVPLQLQLLGCEYLDGSRVSDNELNGIHYDDIGRRVGYFIYQKHPATAPTMKSVEVPADQLCHLYKPLQPGLERGVSWLAPALVPAREIQEYLEAELVKQKISSLYCGFVQSPDGSNPLNPALNGTNFSASLEPGSMTLLGSGQLVEFSDPPDLTGAFDAFLRAQLRMIASALNVPYELLTGDLSGVTFASGRHALLAYRRVLESIQYNILVPQLLRPILRTWVRLAVAMGQLPGTPEDYRRVRWIGPTLEALDPRQEVAANIAKVRAGFATRRQVVSGDGWDLEQLDEEASADNARVDRLGLVLDSDPRKTTLQGMEQQSTSTDAVIA